MSFADTVTKPAFRRNRPHTVAPGALAVLVLDGAGWQGGKDLAIPGNVSLLTLPPNLPELNPVENGWQMPTTSARRLI